MALNAFLSAHDLRMFGLAGLISMLLCLVTMYLMPTRPVRRDAPSLAHTSLAHTSLARTALAGTVLGGAIWCAFLLCWKGFFPFVHAAIPVSGILSSIALAIIGATIAVAIVVHGETGTRNTLLAASILAASASCMLFVAMSALAAPLVLGYDLMAVLASMVATTALCALGFYRVATAETPAGRLWPALLVALALPILDIASFAAILPFNEWETVAATPNALALQPLTVVFLSEFATVLALTRAGAALDRQFASRTRLENDRLRQLTDSTFEGLLVHRDGVVIDANTAFCAMAELPLDQIKGRPIGVFAAVFPAPDSPIPLETDLHPIGGEPIPVEMLSRVINLGDGHVLVTAVRDIRERREAEHSARDRQRVQDLQHENGEARERQRIAEEASRAKSAFLAMMSHEIRTPMNAVLGLTSTLLSETLTPDQRQVVRAIHGSGDSLLRILNDILDFSRLDAGRMTFELIPFSPSTLTQETLSVHGPMAVEKGLRLKARQEADLPARLVGDAGRIGQVLHNLVSNALKFTKTGGVTVNARCVTRHQKQATIEWSVSDTGIGIAPEKLSSLFDAFVQADNSITRRFGGSGLGLAISKQLIEQMGGTIWAESTPGKGSTFHVRLTLDLAAQQETPAEPPGSDAEFALRLERLGRPLKLLLAEDNAVNKFVFSRLLKGTPIEIDIADNGLEAVRSANESRYDLICMDMSMPEMDGLEATREIRRGGGPNAGIPIIAMTANAFPEDVAACRGAGMTDFVSKPVNRHTLIGAILRALPSETPDVGSNIVTEAMPRRDTRRRPALPDVATVVG